MGKGRMKYEAIDATLCSSRNFQTALSARVFEAPYKAAVFPSFAA